MKSQSLKIYNASAGSGKTFTLVKNYLVTLLRSNKKNTFKELLALTFTNKAVGEMKDRIINTLKGIAYPDRFQCDHEMSKQICETLKITSVELQKKSELVLNEVSHHYAGLTISTIDKFNYSIIKTFANDLHLTSNFEVEMDTNSFMDKTIERLIQKTETDKDLSRTITDFVLKKIDDDKSWNINDDLKQVANLFLSESHWKYIKALNTISSSDFKKLQKDIENEIASAKKQITETSKKLLLLLGENQIDSKSFNRENVPVFMKNCVAKLEKTPRTAKWLENVENETLYKKTTAADQVLKIDSLKTEIIIAVHQNLYNIKNILFYNNILKNLIPLSIINELKKCFETLKAHENKLLISEFNTIISNEIKDQPTPYIYERLGQKFQHFFIDEFQDTSEMQWENLTPLIEDSLSSESNPEISSLLLVGDAKQAIYRWRGGKVEQFIKLSNNENPFFIEGDIQPLKYNYRSSKTIVAFNNSFFNFIAKSCLKFEPYAELYENAQQKISNNTIGYVEFNLIKSSKELDNDQYNTNKTIHIIKDLKKRGYSYEDICIITRKKSESIKLSQALIDNQIPISSSETLLLKNALEILILIALKRIIVFPNSLENKLRVLELFFKKYNNFNFNEVASLLIKLENALFFEKLNEIFDYTIEYNSLKTLSLLDLTQKLIFGISSFDQGNPFLQKYLDIVYQFQNANKNNLNDFLEHWEINNNTYCLDSQNQNAVKLMTIHKSKGLEFPVVIFPYANQKIYFQKNPKVWFPVSTISEKFKYLYLDFNESVKNFNATGEEMFTKNNHQLELDAINLLYVTLTRAEKELYVIGSYDTKPKSEEAKTDHYTGLLFNYLNDEDRKKEKWKENNDSFYKGKQNINDTVNENVLEVDISENYKFNSSYKHLKPLTPNLKWKNKQQLSISKGVLIHKIMSFVYTIEDIDFAINHFKKEITELKLEAKQLKNIISEIVTHPELKTFFSNKFKSLNEKEIIDEKGNTLIPDKLIISQNKEITIIDYKTGKEDFHHTEQLNAYEKTLKQMGYLVNSKVLIYINEEIKIVKIESN